MDVEGDMREFVKCDIAVIRLRDEYNEKGKIIEMCGTYEEKFIPYRSVKNELRIRSAVSANLSLYHCPPNSSSNV